MTTNSTSHARYMWRFTRLVARAADKMFPFWWNDPECTNALFRNSTPLAARCWSQHIRQRKGL